MAGGSLLSAACLLLVAASALGQVKTVICKDGRRITGTVTLSDGVYKVATKLAEVNVPASEVEAVIGEVSTQQEYQQRRAQIDPNSADDHVKLGRWALEQQLLQQAREEFQAALNLKPGHEMAALLLQQVELKIRGRQAATATSQSRPSYEERIEDSWLVSEEDINRIRVAETGGESRGVVVRFTGDVLEQFIRSQRNNKDFQDPAFEKRFRSMRTWDQLAYIVKNLDPNNASITDDIVVLSDPKALRDFRQPVWRLVAQSCAAADCHGGSSPVGGLKLFRARVRDERIDYTNFVILDGFVGAGGNARMIDRASPEKSLLLQYGLPPERAEMKHPVKLRQPVFAAQAAAAYRRVRDWIALLKSPHPSYRLDYRPPMGMKLNFESAGSRRTQTVGEPARED
jgi:hypothetical protein